MIDFEQIGKRIQEERKYILKVSQETMAEALLMYQTDISNIERGKKGSGISDLNKLDDIAEYLGVPLETLLFGRRGKNMIAYHGADMLLRESKKKILKSQCTVLQKLTGQREKEEFSPVTYECGPYTLYTLVETQISFGSKSKVNSETGEIDNPEFYLPKLHTYIFMQAELIGVMVCSLTSLMQHIHMPTLQKLQTFIPYDVLDVTDVLRTLNPYWALWNFTNEGEDKDRYFRQMLERMDVLRETGEDKPILYIENVYIKEEYRRYGMFRLYIDLLKEMYPNSVLWLNMEPTSGAELDHEYDCIPSYTVSELGQLNINAAIAERLGFKVDPDTWHRNAEVVDTKGNRTIETLLVRKCAYYMPQDIREVTKEDGDLVLKGRALQKLLQEGDDNQKQEIMDLNRGLRGEDKVCELKVQPAGKGAYYVAVITAPEGRKRYVISPYSVIKSDKECFQEEYASLHEAEQSEYYEQIRMVDSFVMMAAETVTEYAFYDDLSYTLSDDEGNEVYYVVEIAIKKIDSETLQEEQYVYLQQDTAGNRYYAINRKRLRDLSIEAAWDMQDLEPIVSYSSEEEMECGPNREIFQKLKELLQN